MRTMHKKMAAVVVCVAAFATSAASQTVIGNAFDRSATDTFTDSPYTLSNYGLTWEDYSNGTLGPSAMLSGYGGINLYTEEQRRMTIAAGGNVGIGTTTPGNPLNVYTAGGSSPVGAMSIDVNTFGTSVNAAASYFFRVRDLGGYATHFYIQGDGKVGIGTTSPAAKLDVNGSINISGAGGSITFPNGGGTQSVAWTGVLCGGDYAESVDVSGDRTNYGPGDVMVIDPNDSGKFLKSVEPYSTAVLGIYSTKPGALGRRQTTPKNSNEVPMAMIGIVPTKVSAENGVIKPGDLLVTSSKPGYAMKGTDRSRLVGAIIGKAMGRLDAGTGVIEVGVTLQ